MLAVAVASTAAAFMVAAVASMVAAEVSTVAVASTAVDFMVVVASTAAVVSTVVVVAVSFQRDYECRMAVGSTLAAILLLGYLHRSNNAIQHHPLYCPCILPAIS